MFVVSGEESTVTLCLLCQGGEQGDTVFVVSGDESAVKRELGDVRGYCEEGVTEARACGDDEMQAEFLLQSVLLDMVDGIAVDDMKTALDVSVQ